MLNLYKKFSLSLKIFSNNIKRIWYRPTWSDHQTLELKKANEALLLFNI